MKEEGPSHMCLWLPAVCDSGENQGSLLKEGERHWHEPYYAKAVCTISLLTTFPLAVSWHALCCCVMQCARALPLQLLLAFSKDISRLRARYLSMQPRGTTSHTVLVTGTCYVYVCAVVFDVVFVAANGLAGEPTKGAALQVLYCPMSGGGLTMLSATPDPKFTPSICHLSPALPLRLILALLPSQQRRHSCC